MYLQNYTWKQRLIYSQLYSGRSPSDRALPENDLFRALCLRLFRTCMMSLKRCDPHANPQVNATSSMVLSFQELVLYLGAEIYRRTFQSVYYLSLPPPLPPKMTVLPPPQIPQHLLSDAGRHHPSNSASASFPGLRVLPKYIHTFDLLCFLTSPHTYTVRDDDN